MTENNELSEREREILRLVATGASNKEIAQTLFISTNTVKVHLRNIFSKIEVESRTEAAIYAVNAGLVNLPAAPEAGISGLIGENLTGAVVTQAENQEPGEQEGILEDRTRRRRPWIILTLVVIGITVLLAGLFLIDQMRANQVVTVALDTTRWEVGEPLPTARSGLALVNFENAIYAIGGETAEGITAATERFDPSKLEWQAVAPKPTPVRDISAAVVGGKVYVPGGEMVDERISRALEIYNPRQNRWETGAPLPVGLSAYALASFEGKLYLFGGWDGSRFIDDVFEYDPVEDDWVEKSSMDRVRGNFGAAVVGGKIYLVGGFDGRNALKNVMVYSPDLDDGTNNPWSTRQALPEGRYAMGISALAETIYIIGGSGEGEAALLPMFYDPQADQWGAIETPIQPTWTSMGVAPFGNYIYSAGGEVAGSPTDQLIVYQAIYTILLPVVR